MASDHESVQEYYRLMREQAQREVKAMSEPTPTDQAIDTMQRAIEEIDRVRTLNDALVTALRDLLDAWYGPPNETDGPLEQARAALALVEPPR